MAEGDYDNKNKARSRYITARMGVEESLKCYKEHLAKVMESQNLDLDIITSESNKEGIQIDLQHDRLIEQKQEGLYTVYFHPIGGILKLDTLKDRLECIERVNDVPREVFELYMEGKLEKDYARLGKFVGDIVREDVPKFLYDLAIKIDEWILLLRSLLKVIMMI